MIKFNTELQEYKSKDFGVISIDVNGTKKHDDAYSIDRYDDDHIFVAVYISNPLYYDITNQMVNSILKNGTSEFSSFRAQPYLDDNVLSDEEARPVYAFKMLIDLDGNVTDFAINKEEVEVDYFLDENDILELENIDKEDANDKILVLSLMLRIMKNMNSLIRSKYKEQGLGTVSDEISFTDFYTYLSMFKQVAERETTKLLEKENMPVLYYNSYEVTGGVRYVVNYFETHFSSNLIYNYPVATFTSPLRKTADFINLAVLDDAISCDDKDKDEIREKWKKKLDGKRIYKSKNNSKNNHNGGNNNK